MKLTFCAVVLLMSFVSGVTSATAQVGVAPWCAVVSLGMGDVYWDCQYATLEQCVPNVLAGNRGTCNHNPRWEPRYERPHASRKRHRQG
jgi:uncharacterized protein DUF3551